MLTYTALAAEKVDTYWSCIHSQTLAHSTHWLYTHSQMFTHLACWVAGSTPLWWQRRWPLTGYMLTAGSFIMLTYTTGGKEGGHSLVIHYHWRELPQVSFLLRQKFCCDKHNLSRQKYACWNKTFVVTKVANICRDNHLFFMTTINFSCLSWQNKCLLWQIFVKTKFVATNILLQQIFCCNRILSRQAYLCRDKRCVLLRQNFCRDKNDTWQLTLTSIGSFCWNS